MIKQILLSFWFWLLILASFIAIILWDDTIEKGVKGDYVKHKMVLKDVNFSQVDKGFETARMYADYCEMDDNQNNMEADAVRVMFFKEEVATWTGRLISKKALKTPFEANFWGNVRMWNSDNERFRTEKVRYFINRKELYTKLPVTMYKDNMVVSSIGMSYLTETKELKLNNKVIIKIWDDDKEKDGAEKKASLTKDELGGRLPEAPALETILPAKLEVINDETNNKSKSNLEPELESELASEPEPERELESETENEE
jgi:LPS export ABC transporter protein LptC